MTISFSPENWHRWLMTILISGLMIWGLIVYKIPNQPLTLLSWFVGCWAIILTMTKTDEGSSFFESTAEDIMSWVFIFLFLCCLGGIMSYLAYNHWSSWLAAGIATFSSALLFGGIICLFNNLGKFGFPIASLIMGIIIGICGFVSWIFWKALVFFFASIQNFISLVTQSNSRLSG